MTNSFVAQFDSMAVPLFQAAGMADAALYKQTSGSSAVSCSVIVDRDVQQLGIDNSVVGNPLIIITCYRAQVSRPRTGSTFVIGAETFTVDSVHREDESRYSCVVVPS